MTKDELIDEQDIFRMRSAIAERSKEDDHGCWIWQRAHSVNAPGMHYGTITYKNKTVRAHRMSWMVFNGAIPKGLCVLHKCDVPLCVNPNHLFLGTHRDNTADMYKKGRNSWARYPEKMEKHLADARPILSGESNPWAKLTDDAVRDIRCRVDSGETRRSVAALYGVNPGTVGKIAARQSWKHV